MNGAPAATSGYPERPNQYHVKGKDFKIKVLLLLQILSSIGALGVSLALIVTQPDGVGTPGQVSLAVFVSIFSLLTWFYIFVIAQRFDHLFPTKSTSVFVGMLAIVFYLA